MAPITNCLKQWQLRWEEDQEKSFIDIKTKLSTAPVLTLLDFSRPFEVEMDASMIGIGAVLTQGGRPIEYFNEKLNETRQCWTTYELELFAIVCALHHWEHYLLQ
ncbi:hypothetical protein LWI29_024858 [Acer saccharum]|uniref:Reverse transcriptase/retrotransposon-derived protein RNase H-like domain-containing protein n=1 Tax=Acer saccharum TaxID=4024 RepID=A0AA39RI72_ACESA|nr:hypothetical protein LWI29_024858 [Acer saccharum]